jgi:hypothetical protein
MGKKLNTGRVPGMCVLNNRNGTQNIGRPAFKSGAGCALTLSPTVPGRQLNLLPGSDWTPINRQHYANQRCF